MQLDAEDKLLINELTNDQLSLHIGGGLKDINPAIVAGVAAAAVAGIAPPAIGATITAGVNSFSPSSLGQFQFQVSFKNPGLALGTIVQQAQQ